MPMIASRRPTTVAGRPSKAEMLARAAGHRRRPYRQPTHSRARLALLLLGCLLLLVAATVAGLLTAVT